MKKKKIKPFIKFNGISGGKKIKTRYELIDPHFIKGLADVLTHGAKKYEDNNWVKCDSLLEYYSACQRHLEDWRMSHDIDEDSGFNHLLNATCCLMFMYAMQRLKPDSDDRNQLQEIVDLIKKQKKKNAKSRKK